jgi:periplasmic copper chaperone A
MKALRVAMLAAALAGPALAHDFRAGEIVIDHPDALAGATSVYFRTLQNTGNQPDRLIGASSPNFGRIEVLHDERRESLKLAAGAELRLRHGGPWRLELPDLKTPLKLGDTVRVTLRFERAGEVTVPADVVNPSTRIPR